LRDILDNNGNNKNIYDQFNKIYNWH